MALNSGSAVQRFSGSHYFVLRVDHLQYDVGHFRVWPFLEDVKLIKLTVSCFRSSACYVVVLQSDPGQVQGEVGQADDAEDINQRLQGPKGRGQLHAVAANHVVEVEGPGRSFLPAAELDIEVVHAFGTPANGSSMSSSGSFGVCGRIYPLLLVRWKYRAQKDASPLW